MTDFLVNKFVKNNKNVTDNRVRVSYGILTGVVGLCANLVLFLSKVLIGFISGSVAIMADAFNNLSDAGSSIVTLFGFKLAAKPADGGHPFGHGRFEYLASLLIAAMIFMVGGSFFKASVDKIMHPKNLEASAVIIAILIMSMGVKLWLSAFNKNIGGKINSSAMLATAKDSLNDVAVTGATLLSIVVSKFFNITIDGYIGLGVAFFILYSAFGISKDTVDTLLGQPADPETINEISGKIMAYDCVYSTHDLIVHNYGPGRIMASVHVEIPASYDILKAHDAIDRIEREVHRDTGIPLVIHLDPIDLDSAPTNAMRKYVADVVHDISPDMDIHDFRMVIGQTHTNLIFDIKIPSSEKMSDERIKEIISNRIAQEKEGEYYTVITFDRAYL